MYVALVEDGCAEPLHPVDPNGAFSGTPSIDLVAQVRTAPAFRSRC